MAYNDAIENTLPFLPEATSFEQRSDGMTLVGPTSQVVLATEDEPLLLTNTTCDPN